MRPRTRSFMPIIFPLMGIALTACVSTGTPRYEVISIQDVSGVSLEMVRRNQLDAEGNTIGSPDYGIVDPAKTFHPCGQAPCGEADFQRVAASAANATKSDGGGGGGSGGGM